MKTKVIFYKIEGEILAVFPELKADFNGNVTSYAHMGQHSACSPEYLKYKRKATLAESSYLLRELREQGYDDLVVIYKK